jgi:hypothetical protein
LELVAPSKNLGALHAYRRSTQRAGKWLHVVEAILLLAEVIPVLQLRTSDFRIDSSRIQLVHRAEHIKGRVRVIRPSDLATEELPPLHVGFGSPEEYGPAGLALALPRLLRKILSPLLLHVVPYVVLPYRAPMSPPIPPKYTFVLTIKPFRYEIPPARVLLHEVLLEHGVLLRLLRVYSKILQEICGQLADGSLEYVNPSRAEGPQVHGDFADTIPRTFSSRYDVRIAPEAQI